MAGSVGDGRIGQRPTVALTTPRFVAVPFIVAGAPIVTTMHAKPARHLVAPLELSLSPMPVGPPRRRSR